VCLLLATKPLLLRIELVRSGSPVIGFRSRVLLVVKAREETDCCLLSTKEEVEAPNGNNDDGECVGGGEVEKDQWRKSCDG